MKTSSRAIAAEASNEADSERLAANVRPSGMNWLPEAGAL